VAHRQRDELHATVDEQSRQECAIRFNRAPVKETDHRHRRLLRVRRERPCRRATLIVTLWYL
jgi:hypothetical protein